MTGNDHVSGAHAVDLQVPWHLGNPFAEQRKLLASDAHVDLGHFGVIRVTGEDRLAWLHLLLTQAVDDLAVGQSAHALVLSATGHIEHDIKLVDDSSATWLIVEPGTADGLCSYLQSMVFMYDITIQDVSAEFAVVGTMMPDMALAAVPGRFPDARMHWHASPAFATPSPESDPYVPHRPKPWPAVLAVVPRNGASHSSANAGMWAWEAARVAAAVPRLVLDIDHRTLPHEVGLIGAAVHLHKGCYRGQEAVARTINLGRPPRRLVLLHLDGTTEHLPAPGAQVLDAEGREVGLMGTAVTHHEIGQIGLALVRRNTPLATDLCVTLGDGSSVQASQEPVVVIGETTRSR